MTLAARRGHAGLEEQRRRVCALAEMAEAHRQQGRYRQAEGRLRQALVLAKAGGDRLAMASLLNNLAVVHKYQGRFAEASRRYRRAQSLLKSVLGPEHPDMATVYHNRGGLEHARGRHA